MRKVEVFIEGQRLDLFEDESINLNRSVQDIKDISKIYTDFTQTFTVPASKNNQKIFRHFEIPEINNGFDTRVKKDGSITLNTLDFVKGKIRLEAVSVKDNLVQNYKITFFGDLVSLKDLLGEDELKDLEWLDQFDHDYNDTNVLAGITDALSFDIDGESRKVLRYPLISPVKRYLYDDESISNDTTANLKTNGFFWYELKPSISFEFLIKAIEEKYGITFSGGFFDREEFKILQLWLAEDKGYMKASGLSLIPFEDNQFFTDGLIIGTVIGSESGTKKIPNQYLYNLKITPVTDEKYNVHILNNGEVFRKVSGISGMQTITGVIEEMQPDTTTNIEVGFYLSSESALIYDAEIRIQYTDIDRSRTTETSYLTNQSLNAVLKIREQMPKLKIVDFLQGCFKMFNLTVIPEDGKLEINTLEEWYSEGKIIDISQYVDTEKVDIEKGTVLGEIALKFAEGESFLMAEFVKNFGRGYGDLEYIIRTSTGEKVSGESLDIILPFEQMIYERLTASLVQYGYCVDDNQEPYKIEPHVFYPALRDSDPVKIIKQDESITTVTKLNMPSHVGLPDLSKFSTTFSADFDEYTGNAILNNLFTNYYSDYITDIFSEKRRVFNYTAKLPVHLIRSLKLNDRLIIKGRRYIINNMEIDLTTNKVDFELINDIYRGETIENLTTRMLFSSYYAEFGTGTTGSFTYQTNETVNYVTAIGMEDLGDGTAWVSFTQTGNTINYTLQPNTTGLDRYTAIKLTGFSGSVTYHKIKQNA